MHYLIKIQRICFKLYKFKPNKPNTQQKQLLLDFKLNFILSLLHRKIVELQYFENLKHNTNLKCVIDFFHDDEI